MNPCPCGNAGQRHEACACTPVAVERYRRRVSGPLLDRIDLQVEVRPGHLRGDDRPAGRGVGGGRGRGCARPARARRRGTRATGVMVNAELDRQALRQVRSSRIRPGRPCWQAAMERLGLSGRGPRPGPAGGPDPGRPGGGGPCGCPAHRRGAPVPGRRLAGLIQPGLQVFGIFIDSGYGAVVPSALRFSRSVLWVGGRTSPVRVAGGPRGPCAFGGAMANEFYTLIVVPHAKARFRQIQVPVRLAKWTITLAGIAGLTVGGVLVHYARDRRRRSTSSGGCAPRTRSSSPRPGRTRRTPASCRPRSSSSRRMVTKLGVMAGLEHSLPEAGIGGRGRRGRPGLAGAGARPRGRWPPSTRA